MIGLIGEFTHKIDDKGRVSLPSKIRSIIGETVIVTKGLDGAAYVYDLAAWDVIVSQLDALSLGNTSARSFARFLLSSASEVSIDKAGRVLLPEVIRAHLGVTDEVVIAGVGSRLELWQPDAWQSQQQLVVNDINQLAENLADIGAI